MKKVFFNLKSKYKAIATLLLALSLCVAIAFGLGTLTNVPSSYVSADYKQELEEKLDDIFEENYWVNSLHEIPSKIETEVGGQTVVASDGVIIWPNGMVKETGTYTLEDVGNYTVRYFINDGEDYVEKTFFVGNKLVSLSLEDNNNTITAVSKEQQAGVKFKNNSSLATVQGDDALIVSMKEGVSLDYANSIDLSNTDENGLCTLISLDYHLLDVVDTGRGYQRNERASANYCYIRVYDSYNENIFVDLYYCAYHRDDKMTNSGVLSARAYNHPYNYSTQGEWRSNWREESDWRHKYTHSDSKEYSITHYKTPNFGMSGTNISSYTHSAVTWKYDPINQLVFVNFGSSPSTTKDIFLTPLNSAYVQNIRAFGGFPSGKVKIKILTDNWQTSESARLDIFRIGNDYGSALIDGYNTGYFVDQVGAPIIDLGIEPTYNNEVYAPLNSTFDVPVPKSITGMADKTTYTVEAFMNYGTPIQYQISIYNGKISITKNTIYTIRYTALGESGGKTEKLLRVVVAGEAKEGIELNIDEQFFTKSFKTGDSIILPKHSFTSFNNAKDSPEDIALNIKAVHSSGEYRIDSQKRKFVPQYVGEYKIIYEYSDNVYNLSKEFTINVTAESNVNFIDQLCLPRYFMKGSKYVFPDIKGYVLDGVNEPIAVDATVSISYDNGQSWTKVNREEVLIDGNDTVIVKYSCANGGDEVSLQSDPIRIVNVKDEKNKFKFNEYFVHDDFTVNDEGRNITYSSKKTSGSNTLKFVNAVDVTKFNIDFKIYGENANYEQLNIRLIDYYDPTIEFVISFANEDGAAVVSFNGSSYTAIDAKFNNNTTKTLSYNLQSYSFRAGLKTGYAIDLRTYFTSSLVFLDVELAGIYGTADVIISRVCSQNLINTVKNDTTNPLISIPDIGGEYTLNSILVLKVPTATDVASTVLDKNVTLSVNHVDGGESYPVSDVNGVELAGVPGMKEYHVKLTQYGKYEIFYMVKDGSGRAQMEPFTIVVSDKVKPEIEFNEIPFTKVKIKVGQSIDARYTVSDDMSSAENIQSSIWVKDLSTNVNYTCHQDKDKGIEQGLIKFVYAGTFEVFAFAKDEAGNYTYKSFKVIVEE